MEKNLLKQSGIIAVIVTLGALGFWFGFAKISLGLDTSHWAPYDMRKDSTVSEQLIIMCGTSGSGIVFGTTSGAWVGTPTDSTLARIGLNTGTGKLEIKNAGTDTASPIVKYHDDLADITPNQHHAQVHGAADHSGNIGTETQISFGSETGHAHTGTDSTKVSYPNLLNRNHGTADHTGNIGTESQITFGTESGHAHTGTDSTKVQHSQLAGMTANDHHAQIHGAADHTGNIGTETQITFGTASGHSHNGSDSTKIDYDTAPVQLGTDTAGNSDNISEGSTNKYYTDDRVATVIGSSSITSPQVSPKITFTSPAVGQFLKIVDSQGNVENGTSSASVDFSAVIGSASTNANFQANLAESGKVLVGLSDIIKLPATTTVQTAQSYGQLYMHITTTGELENGHIFLSHFDNAGSIFSAIPSSIALTALGNAVGTTTAIFSGNSLHCDGSGDGVGLGAELNGTFDQTFTIDFNIKTSTIAADCPFAMLADSNTFLGIFPHAGNGNTYFVCHNGGIPIFDYYIVGGNAIIADNAKHHIEIDRNGADFYIFIDGSPKNLGVNTAIGTTTIPSFGATCTAFIGGTTTSFVGYGGITYDSINGDIDEFRVFNITSHTGTFTSPAIAYSSAEPHTQYSTRYLDPVNGNTVLGIITPGTMTTLPSIAFFDTTHTIVGSSTSAYTSTGTGTIYKLLVDSGKSLSQDWVLTPSSSAVKTDLPGTPTTEVLDIVRDSAGHKFLYKDKLVADAVVEAKALYDYITEDEEADFELFMEVYQNEYISGEIGSQSVNFQKMKDDFSLIHANNKTVEWIDTKFVTGKADRIKRTKAYLEMDKAESRNNTANYGIEIDRNCPAEILEANGLPSTAKWIGFNFVAIKGLVELVDGLKSELGSATAEIEALKAIINP